MCTEEQNHNWACLTKATRADIRESYKEDLCIDNELTAYFIETLFGVENVSSDSEPGEILRVEKEKVLKAYKAEMWGESGRSMLKYLFGDECMPNKSLTLCEKCANAAYGNCHVQLADDGKLMPIDDRESCDLFKLKKNMSQPKFHKGDKVVSTNIHIKEYDPGVMVIDRYVPLGTSFIYFVDGKGDLGFLENDLKRYTESEIPSFKPFDKVKVKGTNLIGTIKEPYSNDNGYRVYFEDGDGGWDDEYSAEDLEPYSKMKTLNESLPEAAKIIEDNFWDLIDSSNTQNDMTQKNYPAYLDRPKKIVCTKLNEKLSQETKELNLCELLRDHEDEKFWSNTFGDMQLSSIYNYTLIFVCPETNKEVCLHSNGTYTKGGLICIYPSRDLYEKYPLDPYSAWMEWKKQQNPNYTFVIKVFAGVENSVSECVINEHLLFNTKEDVENAVDSINKVLYPLHN